MQCTDEDLFKFAKEHGMIDLSSIQEQMEIDHRKKTLAKHNYSIWQGRDGKWYTYLLDANGTRKLKKRNTEKQLEDIVVEYWEDKEGNPSIKDIFTEWNDERFSHDKIAASTHTRNQQIFDRHFGKFGERKIKSVTLDDFVMFLEGQQYECKLTAKAFSNLKCITRGIIKRARRKKLIDYTADAVIQELDVSERDFKHSAKSDSEEVFNEEETDKVQKYLIAHQDIWNLGLLLIFGTGLRVGELVALKWEDITDENDAIHVSRTETKFKGEDNKYHYAVKDCPKTEAGIRTVAIPQSYQWIIPEIRKIHDDQEYVFVRNGKRMTTNSIRKRLYKVCKELGISKRSPHKIRKTYCSILFENLQDTKLITSQMGHTDIACSEKYYHKDRKDLDEKIKELSSIPEFNTKFKLVS